MESSMFAVVKTGGKQYKVAQGQIIDVEKLTGDVGQTVELDEVLLVSSEKGTTIGQPLVDGAKVTAEILSQKKGPKAVIFKKLRRQGKQLTKGHRQELTRLKITDLVS